MVAAHMRKAALLEDQNLLMLMSMPNADLDAKEYMHLRRQMELRKHCKLMAEEEDCDRVVAKEAFDAEAVAANATVSSPGEWSLGAEGEGLHSQCDRDAEDHARDEHHQHEGHDEQMHEDIDQLGRLVGV